MSLTEETSRNPTEKIMATRRLAHALHDWIQRTGDDTPGNNPENLYIAAQETIDATPRDASMKDMLEHAKQALANRRTPTEWEIIGVRFRQWLAQQEQTLNDQPRAVVRLATFLFDVQRAMPQASAQEKLEAIRTMWTIESGRFSIST